MRIDPAFDQAATGYLASLTHLHSPYGHGRPVCRICMGPTRRKAESAEHWEICWPCRTHRTTPGVRPEELADATGFIIYALEQENGSADQSLRDMYQYKLLPPGAGTPRGISESGGRVRTLLYIALRDNLPVLVDRFGPVEVITHVPSTSAKPRRNPHALSDALDSAVSKLPGIAPHQTLLTPAGSSSGSSRVVDPARFFVAHPAQVVERHILLVEDTWVSGASAQSAAIALHRAGARHVTVLCVARLLQARWTDGHYLTSHYPAFPPPRPGTVLF